MQHRKGADSWSDREIGTGRLRETEVRNCGGGRKDLNTVGTHVCFLVYSSSLSQMCRGLRSLKSCLYEDFQSDWLPWFASFQAMCGHQDPEKLQSSLNTDPHSPLPLRVCGPVSNSQDFAKHFHCPSGSPMNPDKKCHIWWSAWENRKRGVTIGRGRPDL